MIYQDDYIHRRRKETALLCEKTIAKEEILIRQDIKKRTSDLLKKVFSE